MNWDQLLAYRKRERYAQWVTKMKYIEAYRSFAVSADNVLPYASTSFIPGRQAI